MTTAAGSSNSSAEARGGIQIEQVRKRQFLALMHDRGAEARLTLGIPGARLMRILAVPQITHFDEPWAPCVGQQRR